MSATAKGTSRNPNGNCSQQLQFKVLLVPSKFICSTLRSCRLCGHSRAQRGRNRSLLIAAAWNPSTVLQGGTGISLIPLSQRLSLQSSGIYHPGMVIGSRKGWGTCVLSSSFCDPPRHSTEFIWAPQMLPGHNSWTLFVNPPVPMEMTPLQLSPQPQALLSHQNQ